jgi:hypothetical protein
MGAARLYILRNSKSRHAMVLIAAESRNGRLTLTLLSLCSRARRSSQRVLSAQLTSRIASHASTDDLATPAALSTSARGARQPRFDGSCPATGAPQLVSVLCSSPTRLDVHLAAEDSEALNARMYFACRLTTRLTSTTAETSAVDVDGYVAAPTRNSCNVTLDVPRSLVVLLILKREPLQTPSRPTSI